MKHHGDVSKINGAEVEPVDIITFGSPCQDLSVAGKRAGIQDGERSNLFFEAVRIIKEMRDSTNGEYPKYAVWENVPGAFSSNKGRDFHAVLEALCSVCDSTVSIPKPYDAKRANQLVWNGAGEIVGDNYSIAWRTLDAQYWGVPQRRKRIYLVADFTGSCAGEILFKPDSLRGNLPQGNEKGQGATADAMGGVDGSNGNGGQLAATLISSYGTKWNGNAGAYNGENFVLQKHSVDGSVGVECLNPWDCQSKRIYNPDGIYCTLPAMDCGGANNQAVIFSFDSLSSNSMKSSNPFSGCRAVDVAKCIDTTYPDPSKNQGGIAIVQPVIALQANGIDRADTAGCNGAGWRENESYTLNTVDRHAVCYGIDQQGGKGGANYSENMMPPICSDSHGTPHAVCYDARGNGDGETAGAVYEPKSALEENWGESTAKNALRAGASKSSHAVVQSAKPPRKYIIRRLLPVECARLQGFPDNWGHLAPYDPADAEFWEQVRKAHAEINGKKYKPVKDLKKWYDKLHTDSAEYKAYGNGLALPNAEYVLHSIAEQGAKTLGSLFDGIGGFPLAGVLNDILPVWASEVEPYAIAVTKSRFKEGNNG